MAKIKDNIFQSSELFMCPMEIETHLRLEDAFIPSPQIEQLIRLFQHDSAVLNSFSVSLLKSYNRVSAAYSELLHANQQLSKHLKLFKNLNFNLDNGSKMIGEVFSHFAAHLDELSSHCHLLSSQLSDSVVYPVTKLVEADLQEIQMLGEHYVATNNEHEEALSKYMKLSKKRDANDDKLKMTNSKELYISRKKLHQVSLHYFSSLNMLQYKRANHLLESGLNYITTQKLFAASCHETFAASSVDDLIQAVLTTVKSVTDNLASETVISAEKIPALENENDHLCYPELPADGSEVTADLTLTSKAGYLFYRSKAYLISHWTRCYVVIQPPSGHLLLQSPGETAASLLMDLTEGDVHALPADVDDRRWVIEITAKKSKKQIYLQAENQPERDEWIAVINHVSGSPISTQSTSDHSAHQQSPSIFSQLKRTIIEGMPSPTLAKASLPSVSTTNTDAEEAPPLSLPEAPIQFDLSSPSEEFPPLPSWLGVAVPNTTGRANPFGEGEGADVNTQLENVTPSGKDESGAPVKSAFADTYPLRFVGSVRIDVERMLEQSGQQVTDQLIFDTIRQIMTARAIHGIFRMSEINMLIAADGVYLLDVANASVKARFPLHRVVHATAHKENNRLFAFVSSSAESPNDLTCHVFESNSSAQGIVDNIHLVEQMTDEIGATAIMSSIAELERQEQSAIEESASHNQSIAEEEDQPKETTQEPTTKNDAEETEEEKPTDSAAD